ncbi:hypothetical protein [Nonlabens xiamenensis]|uniref:hypothetical protein n=1 Tax=Nonlabens xiamenensis TaxID=2341043 RepID=UPI000F60B325|nr:hypothetical protein [Nonlabens xiamenensis]
MEKDELIQKLILGTAKDEEQAEAERLLKTDADFRRDWDEAKEVHAALIKNKSAELKEMFQDLENKTQSSSDQTPGDKVRWLWPLMAASAAAVLFLVFFDLGSSNQELYDAYYEPYRNVVTSIERGDNLKDDLVSRAFYNYELKKYDLAYEQLGELYSKDSQGIYLFYQANSALGNEDLENAIKLYKEHQQLQDDFYARSRWYLALSYLKNGQVEMSRHLLKEIVSSASYNYKNAAILLKEIQDK